jgi:hypothetical protein
MPTTATRGSIRVLLAATALALAAAACAPGNEVARQLRIACNDGNPRACADYAGRLQKGEYTLRDLPRPRVLAHPQRVGL